jgi:xylulokinase
MGQFIGIDSGTQSVKAVVVDWDERKVVAEARAPHRMIPGLPPGHCEQHPSEWVRALDAVLRQVCARIDPKKVRAVGVSGQQHGFVPLDGAGKVIRPAKLWCDTSTAVECVLLTQKLGGVKAVIRETGLPFLPGYTAPKVLWLKRHEPANFRRLRRVLLPHDYLNFHLTGIAAMEYGDASGTALFDVRRRRWSEAALAAVDRRLADWLPEVGASDRPVGLVQPALARRYGFSAEVMVSAGGGDNMMSAIGTGNVVPGVVTASFGTSGTIFAYANRPAVDPIGEIAAFCSSTGGWLPLLCTMNVTGVTEAARNLFGYDHAQLDAAARMAPPGAGGLVLLPYLSGERTPNVPRGTGVLYGLRHGNFTAGHFARAAMEGVTLGMNYGLGRLRELGIDPKEIRVTGGGARSPLWRQITADVFGVPVVAMQSDESAALGAALQAAWCHAKASGQAKAKIEDFTAPMVKPNAKSRCHPDPKRVSQYQELQAIQNKLSTQLRAVFDTTAPIPRG